MGTRNRVRIGLLYQPARDRICKPFKEPGIYSQPGGPVRQPYLLYRLARLHRLAGLLKHLQIRTQATLDSGIDFLESIPWLHNVKNEDEGHFFWIEMNIFVPQLSKG